MAEETGGNGGLLSISWGNVVGVPDTLDRFLAAPAAFIVGAVLDVLIGGFETVVEAFIDAIVSVGEAFAAVPRSAQAILLDAGGGAGSIILTALNGMFRVLTTAIEAAGPGAPIIAAAVVALTILAAAYTARAIVTAVKLIP